MFLYIKYHYYDDTVFNAVKTLKNRIYKFYIKN